MLLSFCYTGICWEVSKAQMMSRIQCWVEMWVVGLAVWKWFIYPRWYIQNLYNDQIYLLFFTAIYSKLTAVCWEWSHIGQFDIFLLDSPCLQNIIDHSLVIKELKTCLFLLASVCFSDPMPLSLLHCTYRFHAIFLLNVMICPLPCCRTLLVSTDVA